MVVDSSALVAMLLGEPDGANLEAALGDADDPILSAATLVEASIVMHRRTGEQGVRNLDSLLDAAGVRTVALDGRQAVLARDAFVRYGKGRHPAALNFGDCFPYALAKSTGRPLLFKGDDFARTDLASALT